MLVVLIILILAVALAVANATRAENQKTPAPQKPVKKAKPQIRASKKYTVLYTYVALNTLLTIIGYVVAYAVQHQWQQQWAKVDAQYQAQLRAYGPDGAVPQEFFHAVIIASLVFGLLFYVGIMTYLLRIKGVKNAIVLLWILFGLDVLGLAVALKNPSWTLILGLAQAGLTGLTLRALIKKRNALFSVH
jgi:ABC-type Fe3+ transport system permease subunit